MSGLFSERSDGYEKEAEWIQDKRFITPLIPRPFGSRKALDVCSGTGIIAEYAANMGWDVSAIDNSKEMLAYVDSGVAVINSDANHLPFEDCIFDLVVCRQGLQYLDIQTAIREMIRVSKKEIRLLHGFVPDDCCNMWYDIFHVLRKPNRRFFSDEYIGKCIEKCENVQYSEDYLFSKEVLVFEERCRDQLERILNNYTHIHHHSVFLSGNSLCFTLSWVLNTIRKNRG